jgi:hypothetical protein
VAAEHTIEDRLRELMRDPSWELPPWPDPQARLARAARRRGMRTATAAVTAAAATAAIATAAALLPAQARPPAQVQVGHKPVAFALPPRGSAGFPVGIYPPPLAHPVLNLVGRCPNPAGLRPLPAGMRSSALAVLDGLGRSFTSDLRLSDRTYWPQLQASWRAGAARSAGRVHVLYSAPLESRHPVFGPPNLAASVRAGCGHRTAADTWLVITGKASLPGLQGEFLLLDRMGHVLVWNAQ